jgi:hypothetical protein
MMAKTKKYEGCGVGIDLAQGNLIYGPHEDARYCREIFGITG